EAPYSPCCRARPCFSGPEGDMPRRATRGRYREISWRGSLEKAVTSRFPDDTALSPPTQEPVWGGGGVCVPPPPGPARVPRTGSPGASEYVRPGHTRTLR